jgi:hypothetical protein
MAGFATSQALSLRHNFAGTAVAIPPRTIFLSHSALRTPIRMAQSLQVGLQFLVRC